MSNGPNYGSRVQFWAGAFVCLGIFNVGLDFHTRAQTGLPFDLAIVLANIAVIAAGLIGILIASCIKSLEERIRRLVDDRPD